MDNASESLSCDLCILGAGAAGLSVAAVAAQLGVRVVLIEQRLMGGDCLNFGCVPSKALLSVAHFVYSLHHRAASLGLAVQPMQDRQTVDFAAVMARVEEVVAAIAPHDSCERFRALGCQVIQGTARFTGPRHVRVNGQSIAFRWAVVATGAAPMIPSVPGLAATMAAHSDRILTNETLFSLSKAPDSMVVIGGGAMGCEMAQAFARLGVLVTLVAPALLPGWPATMVAPLAEALIRDGVRLCLGDRLHSVQVSEGTVLAETAQGEVLSASHLCLATGRLPRVEGLGLESAGIRRRAPDEAIWHDGGLRTSNRRIFLAGDVVGGLCQTHLASAHAGVVIRRCLFGLPAKAPHPEDVPQAVYTQPELARIGLLPEHAQATGGRVIRIPASGLDRAVAEGSADPAAALSLVLDRHGRMVGACCIGPGAAEQIAALSGPIQRHERPFRHASAMLPYPSYAEWSKKAASEAVSERLFSPLVRWGVRQWMAWRD